MEKLSAKEVLTTFKKILSDTNTSNSEYFYGDTEESTNEAIDAQLGQIDVISEGRTGKYRGDDKEEELIIRFTSHDVYLRLVGWYNSWAGTEFENDWTVVEPVEVTRIEYRKVKL